MDGKKKAYCHIFVTISPMLLRQFISAKLVTVSFGMYLVNSYKMLS